MIPFPQNQTYKIIYRFYFYYKHKLLDSLNTIYSYLMYFSLSPGGLEKMATEHTKLIYVTTGVLLQKLVSAKTLTEYSHIFIDEVDTQSAIYKHRLLPHLSHIYLIKNSVKQ